MRSVRPDYGRRCAHRRPGVQPDSYSAAEILRRLYGAGGHAMTVASSAVPGVSLQYTTFNQITDDIDDARVYGGIHFRFDQDAGGRLGRAIATFIYKHNLRARTIPIDPGAVDNRDYEFARLGHP